MDSVEERNRLLAAQLLAAADLWLFVTSAARYADQVPWGFLKQAAERSAAVAIVLDRTPDDAIETVSTHLARMLASRGLKDSPLFTVTEGEVDSDGLLPAHHVAEIRAWLDSLAADADARTSVVRQTVDGAIRSISRRAHAVADGADAQVEAAARLRDDADASYDRALSDIDAACADGSMLRGEVLARWQEFVGTGELLRSLETKVGWIRDRVVNAVEGKPQQAERVTVAVESGLETLILEHAEAAAERAEAAWQQAAAGRSLLESADQDLGRASRELRRKAERAVRDWQQDVLDMVRTEGADKRGTARFLSFGVNGLAVALMVVVFVHTAGLTGTEAGIAGGQRGARARSSSKRSSVTRRSAAWPNAPVAPCSSGCTDCSTRSDVATSTCSTASSCSRQRRSSCASPHDASTISATPHLKPTRRVCHDLAARRGQAAGLARD